MFDPPLHGSEFLRSCWGELRGGGERAMVCVGEAELNIPPQKQSSRNTRGENLLDPFQQPRAQEQEGRSA